MITNANGEGFRSRWLTTASSKPDLDDSSRGFVVHMRITNAEDYFTRRESPLAEPSKWGTTVREHHINRCLALREEGSLLAAGPSPDGKRADVFLRVESRRAAQAFLDEDPYVTFGVWVDVELEIFSGFIGLTAPVPVVWDGTRRRIVVEGAVLEPMRAERQLRDIADAGRLSLGGILGGDRLLALVNTADEAEAMAWVRAWPWRAETMRARVMLHVL